MNPVVQTKLHIPGRQNGNCLAAAFASLLEIPIEDIPCFEDMSDEKWYLELLNWTEGLGFQLCRWDKEMYFHGYYLVCGKSPRGNFNHIVVFQDGQMVHDPHPDGTGLELIKMTYVLIPLDPSRMITIR